MDEMDNRIGFPGGDSAPYFGVNYRLSFDYIPRNITWSLWPVGGQRILILLSSHVVVYPDTLDSLRESDDHSVFFYTPNASRAGVYTCNEGPGHQKRSVLLVLISKY